MTDTIIERCEAQGLRLTEQRRTIATVLEEADDHPDVEELYSRASAIDPKISLATVYRARPSRKSSFSRMPDSSNSFTVR